MSETPALDGAPRASLNVTCEPVGDTLFKLILSRTNKAEIFEYGLSKLSDSQKDASLILSNLNRWNPNVASVFAPRSVETILDTPFRLIYPNDALPSFCETGLYARQYMAVSYCWRSDDFLPDGYERHGDWPISKTFVDAILSDKNHPRVGIWMDQLCIDQSSSIDKQESVAAMDIIYRSCIRLLILLEDVFLDEKEAALHEKYDATKRAFGPGWTIDEEDSEACASFYAKVNAARWWERAWCLHEFNVNEPWSDKRKIHMIHNATFIMNGPKGSTVKIKWVNLQLIMCGSLYAVPDVANNVLQDFKGQAIFVGSGAQNEDDKERGLETSLMARHNGVAQKGSKYLADKLSIMINMCGLGLAYVGGEPRSKDEVLYLSALLALAAGEVYPLSMFHNECSVKLSGAPTWLCRSYTGEDTAISKFRRGSVTAIHAISTATIELDMIFFHSLWRSLGKSEVALTYRVFPSIIPTTMPKTHIPGAYERFGKQPHPDEVLDGPRRQFLAACISNGYEFTARLWAQLLRDVVAKNWNTGAFKDLRPNSALRTAAQALMAHLLPVTTLLGIAAHPGFTEDNAELFLTWLTDPRAMYYISACTWRLACGRDSAQALITNTFVSENFEEGSLEEMKAAVPTDMLDLDCIPMRVWLLRPAKGQRPDSLDCKWRIVGKACLLGEPDLMREARESEENGATVLSLRRMVVGG